MTRRTLLPRQAASRAGMTLVEMLVATAATLLLMAAIAQVFGAFGTAVSDSRAMIELDGRIRTAAWRLRSDLAGATAHTVPPLDPETGDGYFELIEGPESDAFHPTAAGVVNKGTNALLTLIAGSGSDDRIVGDYDDVLLFTTRSTDPLFQGRFTVSATSPQATSIESPVAEVGWFLRPTPGTSNPVTFTLYRKQLLVLGYVGVEPFYTGGVCSPNTTIANTAVVPSNTVAMPHGYFPWGTFFDRYDISARFERNAGAFIPNKTDTVSPGRLLPNTLADLTRREARFMHNVVGDTSGARFSRDTAGTPNYGSGFCVAWEDHNHDGAIQQAEDAQNPANGLLDGGHLDPNVIPDGLVYTGNRQGEDVILTNVIAFDVRVFDPEAPIPLAGSTTALVPGDPGYVGAYLTSAALNPPAFAQGAYVDLGNGTMKPGNPPNNQVPVSRFSGFGQPRSVLRGSLLTPRVWDSWSTHYETNGRNDDGWLSNTTVDQGTNGLDDNTNGRVDETDPSIDLNGDGDFADSGEDPGETETQPPYPYPLRGIEIRIRCYEPSSRQVRQVTVRHSFVSP